MGLQESPSRAARSRHPPGRDASPEVSPPADDSRALQQAQRDLMRAAQLAFAGELVGGIVHDLRQPITALEINVELAKEMLAQSPPDITNAAAAVRDALADVHLLVDSVQVLQDLVTRREPRRLTIDVAAVVQEVTRLVQTEASTRRVTLAVGTSPDLPLIRADPTMLREAVLSLLLDALEHATEGTGRVDVATRAADGGVELSVTYGLRPEAKENEAWALSVARSVAAVHGATIEMTVNPMSEVTVRMLWPTHVHDVDMRT